MTTSTTATSTDVPTTTTTTTTVAQRSRHFDTLLSEASVKTIKEIHDSPSGLGPKLEMGQIRWPKLGNLSLLKPMIDENRSTVIERLKRDPLTKSINTDDWASTCNITLNDFQMEVYSLLRIHQDLLYTNESLDNLDDIQSAYTLHMLTHLFNSRSTIISNNKVFERKTLSDNIIHDDPVLRDQGFTRARVLLLLPFRYAALKIGKEIVKLLGDKYSVTHMDRFIKEFGDEDGVDTTLRPFVPDMNKPGEFSRLFHGNTDDAFRVGIKLTKKSVKFFSDFYDSDIIIASPLGLKTILSPEEQQAVYSDSEQVPATGDRDFLSSIEVIILDMADVFLMQNWEHVLDVMSHVNNMPLKPRKVDIARVRLWHLEDWSRYYRQLVMFTSISVPLVHSFFQKHSLNYEGYFTFRHRVDKPAAEEVKNKCRQQFLYYDSMSAKEACDDRFNYFVKHVLPRYTSLESAAEGCSDGASKEQPGHVLIFVSSYFDYVRLRNYFRREKLSFTQICEYTEDNKVAKARQLFYFGARQFLLYTERCHFYHRYKIKGVRHIVFYEAPIYGKFYTELAKMLVPELQGKKFDESTAQFSATTLFSNHDTLLLGAIVGYSNAVKLIQNKNSLT